MTVTITVAVYMVSSFSLTAGFVHKMRNTDKMWDEKWPRHSHGWRFGGDKLSGRSSFIRWFSLITNCLFTCFASEWDRGCQRSWVCLRDVLAYWQGLKLHLRSAVGNMSSWSLACEYKKHVSISHFLLFFFPTMAGSHVRYSHQCNTFQYKMYSYLTQNLKQKGLIPNCIFVVL